MNLRKYAIPESYKHRAIKPRLNNKMITMKQNQNAHTFKKTVK